MVASGRAGRHIAAGLLLACACLQAGCAVALAGGAAYGAIKYANNGLERDFAADLEPTWQAAIASLQENGHPLSGTASHGATSGVLQIADVTVRVATHPQGKTRVSIRIGTFDTDEHRRRANLIMEGIARRLGA